MNACLFTTYASIQYYIVYMLTRSYQLLQGPIKLISVITRKKQLKLQKHIVNIPRDLEKGN